VDPGVEAVALAQPRELPPGRDEGLLYGVLGPSDVTQDPVRDGEQPICRAAGDGGECLLVPGPRGVDERSVHASPTFVRVPQWAASPSMSANPPASD
jgi:hypothetical protein